MSELYRHFGSPMASSLDFSDEALISLYNAESYGTSCSLNNGFAIGKKFLNLQVTAWQEMLREGTLAKFELYEDPAFPHEWLDSVLKNTYTGYTYEDLLTACRKSSGFD
jgi:hypothetical protein